jgi:hypothetical protein
VLERLLRGGAANWIPAFFVFVDENDQKSGKFHFFRCKFLAFIERRKFVSETFALLVRADYAGKSSAKQLAVGLLIGVDRSLAHRFQVPLFYSECVSNRSTKTIWVT